MSAKIDRNELLRARGDWEKGPLAEALDRTTPRRPVFSTNSGIPLKTTYTPVELEEEGSDYLRDIGFPGQYPYTRGITPLMYRGNFWVMGQYSGYGSAEEANRRYRYLLEQGQTGFSIALDLPTQMGYDSDDPQAQGEVGKVGVAVDSLEDVEILFDGIPLQQVRQIRTTANAISPVTVALLTAFCEKNGIKPDGIRIFLQNDTLKEFLGRGAYIFPPKTSVKLAADVIEYCSQNLRSWVPMAVCGYHLRDSGCTAVQELAFTLANARAYFEAVTRRGLSVDDFAPKLFTFLSAHLDLLEEVAKFRAARRLWARMLKEKFGAANPSSMKLNILAYTMGGALTAQQPLNNIVRVTIEALAAVLGGVQTLATSSYDEALSIPTEDAVTVALRTQQVIAHESGVANLADPLGGSYAVESLTNEIERQVLAQLERIESLGGAIRCIEEGIIQREIADAAYSYQKSIESRDRIVVGVNEFKSSEKTKIPVFRVDPEGEKRQVERLKALKARRDGGRVATALAEVERVARRDENIIPACIEAVRVCATLGEICGVLRGVYGTYRDQASI